MNNTALLRDLRAWVAKNREFLSETRVYSQREWRKTHPNDQYGQNSACVITTEDCLYEGLNYGGNEHMFAIQYYKILAKHGYWEEPAHGWMRCIEPLENPDARTQTMCRAEYQGKKYWDWLKEYNDQGTKIVITKEIVAEDSSLSRLLKGLGD